MSINPNEVRTGDMPPYPHEKTDTIVPPPEHRDDKHDKKLSPAKKAGIAVVTLLISAGAAFGVNEALKGDKGGSAESPAPTPDNATSAPASSEEIADVSLEGIQTVPTKEQIKKAQTPIDGSLSPEEAIVQMGQRLNVFANSGKIDPNSTNLSLTENSTEEGDLILQAIYGNNIDETKKSAQEELRINRASGFYVDSVGNLRLSTTFEPDTSTLVDLGNNTFQVEYDEINYDSEPNNSRRDVDFRTRATISNAEGNWVIVSTESLGTTE